MISHETIDDIKYRSPIEDVIGSYVNLSRAGSNLKGLCPFHSEKTPSFIVFPASQDFHCFGCGAGGDVISFVMRNENLEYVEAVQFLAKRCGITLVDSADRTERGVTRTKVLEMNRVAAKYFHDCLMDPEIGKPGRDYFSKRHLSGATIKHFGLGYAPASFTALVEFLRSKGYSDEEILAANLASRSTKNNKIYDFFRGRVMFPIIDVTGEIVAFGGRVLDGSEPKYLNSSDTVAFKKSKHLFALNFAKKNCSDQMILCEGYMDVIALHQAGFENAVATLGTAITPDHARIFKRYTSTCLISYDADAAGQKAASNAFRLLDEVGLTTKIIKVTDAKDPDEFISKFGADAFRKILDNSRSRFDFVYQNVKNQFDFDNPEQKAKAIHELCSFIASYSSPVQIEIYQKELSSRVGISEESVKNEIKKIVASNKKANDQKSMADLKRKTSGLNDRVNPDFAKTPKIARLEEIVLGLMMYHTEYIHKAKNGMLSEDDFSTAYGKKLFSCLMKCPDTGSLDYTILNESLTIDEVSRASSIVCARKELTDNGPAVFDSSVRLLKEEVTRHKKKQIKPDLLTLLEEKKLHKKKEETE